LAEKEAAAARQARSRVFSVTGRTSLEIRRQSIANAAVELPAVIHISSYRRRRREKVGGPIVNLEAGIVRKRSYTNVVPVVSFIVYAGLMVGARRLPRGVTATIRYQMLYFNVR